MSSHVCSLTCPCKTYSSYYNKPVEESVTVQSYLGNPGDLTSILTGQAILEMGSNLQFWTGGSVYLDATQGSAKLQIETNNILIGVTGAGFTGSENPPLNIAIPAAGFEQISNSLSIWDPFVQSWLPVETVGSTGPQGAGITGLVGVTGSTGPQGMVGVTGSTGPQGMVGVTGSTGPQGMVGVTGSTGPQGMVGVTGST